MASERSTRPIISIVERNEAVQEILAMTIDMKWDACIQYYGSYKEVPLDSDLVIGELPLNQNQRPVGGKLLLYGPLSPEQLNISAWKNPEALRYVQVPIRMIDLQQQVQSLLNKEESSNVVYVSVSLDLLQKVGKIPVPLFLRLTESKYVKIWQPGQVFNVTDVDHYKEKDIYHLHVPMQEIQKLLNALFLNLQGISLSSEATSLQELWGFSSNLIKTLHQVVHELHLPQEAVDLINHQAVLVRKAVSSQSKLLEGIHGVKLNPTGYLHEHSAFLAFVCAAIAIKLREDHVDTLQSLILASLIHDLMLPNSELARYQDIDQATLGGNFSPEELRLLAEHPTQMAEIASNIEGWANAAALVAIHHEKPDGSGFPKGLKHGDFDRISGIFVLGHRLVSAIYEQPLQFALNSFLPKIENHWQLGNFKNILQKLAGS